MALMCKRKDKPLLRNEEIQQEEEFQKLWEQAANAALQEEDAEYEAETEDW